MNYRLSLHSIGAWQSSSNNQREVGLHRREHAEQKRRSCPALEFCLEIVLRVGICKRVSVVEDQPAERKEGAQKSSEFVECAADTQRGATSGLSSQASVPTIQRVHERLSREGQWESALHQKSVAAAQKRTEPFWMSGGSVRIDAPHSINEVYQWRIL